MKPNPKLLDLFSHIQTDGPLKLNRDYNSHVLIVDGMNTFLRSFAVINQINQHGNHIGGITGFLKSIGSSIKMFDPSRVIIVFDGPDGSRARKNLYPEYKANRNLTSQTNVKAFRSKKEEDKAKYNEMIRLMDYLNFLPVNCMAIHNLEADDLIGYVSNKIYREYEGSRVTIVSADRDFLQLVNDRINIYSPVKKKIYTVDDVIEEFQVHPENYLLYKTLIGDSSDNIPGVTGIGEKNVLELFDILKDENRRYLSHVYEICESPPKKSKLYERILNVKNQVEVFYEITNLREPNISQFDKEDIDRQFYRKVPNLKKYDFVKTYNYDKMNDAIPYVETWLDVFSSLNNF